jgi:hypothetical protein
MLRCQLTRLAAIAVISFLTTACAVDPAGDTPDAGAVQDTGATPGCQRSRDCELDERCVNGTCEPRQTTCGDDTDCPQGQVCRDEACVQDSRTPCQAHDQCTNGGEICIADAQTQQGFCEGISDQSCQENGDCFFGASDSNVRGLCEEGSCKGDQFFGCAIAQDCGADFNCTPLNGRSMCLMPCVTNEVCDRTLECNGGLQHCWYNLCGNSTELSSNFADTNNGRLGGACSADVPAAPAPTNCVQDSDCGNLGGSARCNSDFGTCEVICDGDTSICGTDATRDWYYCAANEDPSPANQACGVGATCGEDNFCATGVACDDAATCLTGQPCGQTSHCVGNADGETCVAGQCRSAALCDGGQCHDPSLCQDNGTCPVEACAEGFGCLSDFCVDTCLTDDQCTNAGDRCTGTLDPAPAGAACDDNAPCEGGAACTNGHCPLDEGTETGTCESITGTCEMMAGDGHCMEVSAGQDQWVGLCLAGGHVGLGGNCGFDAERGEKDKWCGGGALCAVANESDPSTGSCHQGCSPEGKHGSVACPEGTTCSNTGGYACIGNDDICDPAQRDGCTENTKCGFFGWEEETAYCVGYDAELPRKAFGEECDNTAQCASGSVCLSLRTNTPDTCTPMCRNDGSVTCSNGMTCSSLESLSRGTIMGPYGLCTSG